MATLKTNLIEPEGATTTLTVGEAGGDLVIGADSLKANTLKSRANLVITTFTADGNLTIPAGGVTADIFMVAGGGGGGGGNNAPSYGGSGGGGGGLLEGSSISLNAGTYTVTVGAGGAGALTGSATAGVNTSISEGTWGTATAIGGGGGTIATAPYPNTGNAGGSGGGGSSRADGGPAGAEIPGGAGNQGNSNGLTGYGNGGGFGFDHNPSGLGAGGGGGGAGTVGGDATGETLARAGGVGRSSDLNGSLRTYSRGGWGAAQSAAGGGPAAQRIGRANTGNGGGAGMAGNNPGGAGGSGIVVVKYTLLDSPQTLFVSDGSGSVSSVDSGWGGVQVLLSSQTASNSSSISFTSDIDSTYDEYIFEFINIRPATDSVKFEFQANASGQSGYNETITSTYFQAYHDEANTTAVLEYSTGQDQAQGTDYEVLAVSLGNDADQCLAGELHLFAPSSTTYVKHFYSLIQDYHTANYSMENFDAGYFNTTAALVAIDFKMSSGNIAAGTIKMYGIK